MERLLDTVYPNYTHAAFSYDFLTLKACEKQIKLHCIISALYTVYAAESKEYIPLTKLGKMYNNKCYKTVDSTGFYKEFVYEGYDGSNNKAGNRLRSSFDTLKEFTCRENPTNYLFNCIQVDPDNRTINEFLKEFSYDMLINQMNGGCHLTQKLNTLKKNLSNRANFRREVKRLISGLNLLDTNFNPYLPEEDHITTLLYYWKKEALFHIDAVKKLVNSPDGCLICYAEDFLAIPTLVSYKSITTLLIKNLKNCGNSASTKFLLTFLSEITIPVYTHTFFIALFEYHKYNLEHMKIVLEEYIKENSIWPESDSSPIDSNVIERINADTIGQAILDIFNTFIPSSPFDDSFMINLRSIGPDTPDLEYIQTSIATAYYENILR